MPFNHENTENQENHAINIESPTQIYFTRQSIAAVIFIFYLVPVVLLTAYSVGMMKIENSWSIFTLGLIAAVGCSLIFYWLLCLWATSVGSQHPHMVSEDYLKPVQQELPQAVVQNQSFLPIQTEVFGESLSEWQSRHSQLLAEQGLQNEEMQRMRLEKDVLQQRSETAIQELEAYRIRSDEEIHSMEQTLKEYQDRIERQEDELGKRQEQIAELKSREQELCYEIKTLLQLARMESAT